MSKLDGCGSLPVSPAFSKQRNVLACSASTKLSLSLCSVLVLLNERAANSLGSSAEWLISKPHHHLEARPAAPELHRGQRLNLEGPFHQHKEQIQVIRLQRLTKADMTAYEAQRPVTVDVISSEKTRLRYHQIT